MTRKRKQNNAKSKARVKASREKDDRKNSTGIPFEKAVARVQQLMDTATKVTHDEKIVDRIGNLRQFDVVVRGTIAGLPALGVIECRDHGRKLGPSHIEAFAQKSRNVHANFVVMVSRLGFTRQALKVAVHEGIGTMSLMQTNPSVSGLQIRIAWYGWLHDWKDLNFQIEYNGPGPSSIGDSSAQPFYDGKPVVNFFRRHLATAYFDLPAGPFHVEATFNEPLPVRVATHDLTLKGVAIAGTRIHQKKIGWLPITGDGFLDWQSSRLKVAPAGVVKVHDFTPNMNGWDDFDGEFPESQPFELFIDRDMTQIEDQELAPDLTEFCTFAPEPPTTKVPRGRGPGKSNEESSSSHEKTKEEGLGN